MNVDLKTGEISKPRCSQYTYDKNFCVKVCELQEDEPCLATADNGIDECAAGLQCLPIDPTMPIGNTCQYPAAYMPYVSKKILLR